MKGKRIIIGLEESTASRNILEFALNFFNQKGNILVGVFIEDLQDLFPENSHFTVEEKISREAVKDYFEETCGRNGLESVFLEGDNLNVETLLVESKFSDMVMLGYRTLNCRIAGNEYLQTFGEILQNAHCPFLVVPEKYAALRNIYLMYDGSPSSLFAIKQFCYLFPLLCKSFDVTLFSFGKETTEQSNGEERKLVAYLKNHCKSLSIHKKFDVLENSGSLFTDVGPEALVIMGHYEGIEYREFSFDNPSRILDSKITPAFIANS